jgi:hypothetical protein
MVGFAKNPTEVGRQKSGNAAYRTICAEWHYLTGGRELPIQGE